ncbi:hypothetical protein C8F01DRAFT_1085158 [Mycena amicta]|nr:hypothetical protein C8F01DRAFT_1085158 [Mycena amicta]
MAMGVVYDYRQSGKAVESRRTQDGNPSGASGKRESRLVQVERASDKRAGGSDEGQAWREGCGEPIAGSCYILQLGLLRILKANICVETNPACLIEMARSGLIALVSNGRVVPNPSEPVVPCRRPSQSGECVEYYTVAEEVQMREWESYETLRTSFVAAALAVLNNRDPGAPYVVVRRKYTLYVDPFERPPQLADVYPAHQCGLCGLLASHLVLYALVQPFVLFCSWHCPDESCTALQRRPPWRRVELEKEISEVYTGFADFTEVHYGWSDPNGIPPILAPERLLSHLVPNHDRRTHWLNWNDWVPEATQVLDRCTTARRRQIQAKASKLALRYPSLNSLSRNADELREKARERMAKLRARVAEDEALAALAQQRAREASRHTDTPQTPIRRRIILPLHRIPHQMNARSPDELGPSTAANGRSRDDYDSAGRRGPLVIVIGGGGVGGAAMGFSGGGTI